MPVKSYSSKRDNGLRMPRCDAGIINAAGEVFHGDVLIGKLSVPEAFARGAIHNSQHSTPGQRVGPDDYDPFLRAHLRMG